MLHCSRNSGVFFYLWNHEICICICWHHWFTCKIPKICGFSETVNSQKFQICNFSSIGAEIGAVRENAGCQTFSAITFSQKSWKFWNLTVAKVRPPTAFFEMRIKALIFGLWRNKWLKLSLFRKKLKTFEIRSFPAQHWSKKSCY